MPKCENKLRFFLINDSKRDAVISWLNSNVQTVGQSLITLPYVVSYDAGTVFNIATEIGVSTITLATITTISQLQVLLNGLGLGGTFVVNTDGTNNYIYFNSGTVKITQIEVVTNTTQKIGGFRITVFVSIDHVNNVYYVTDQGTDTVKIMDLTTNVLVRSVSIVSAPTGIAYDAVSGYYYVAKQNVIQIRNATTDALISTIFGFSAPQGVVLDVANDRYYVAQETGGTGNSVRVMKYSDNTQIRLDKGHESFCNDVGLSPTEYYIANTAISGGISIRSSSDGSYVRRITLSESPSSIRIDSTNNVYYLGISQRVEKRDLTTDAVMQTFDLEGNNVNGIEVDFVTMKLYACAISYIYIFNL